MNRRLTWTLCAVIGASALGAAHGQAPDCDPATRACFDIRVDRAHSRFPGHALTPTGVMAIRCKQFHLPDL